MYKPFIFICIPNMGNLRVELVERLLHWMGVYGQFYRFHVYMPSGMLPLDNARNHCVSKFFELSNHPEDRLWFIDDDIVPPHNAPHVLMEHNKDVVGLLCFMMKPDDSGQPVPLPVACKYNQDKKYVVYFDGTGLTEVDALGGGCIMIKRRVYEEIGERPYTFHYYPDGQLSLVGDYDFCQKAQKAGFKIWVDFGSLCGHFKAIDLKVINNLMVKMSGQNG